MKKSLIFIFLLFTIMSCDKDSNGLTNLDVQTNLESNITDLDGVDCAEKIKGKLKNDKHRQLVKKYYDENVNKDLRLNKVGKVEWNHIITIDNYKQVMSIVPITKNGGGKRKEVTHVYVMYTNWFGHKYLLFDKIKDRSRIKDKELFDEIFKAADYVFNCDIQTLETRGECTGIIEWLFGPSVDCPNFGPSFWSKVGSFFSNIEEAVFVEGGENYSGSDWANYFYFGHGYNNNSALYYTGDGGNGGGGNGSSADPTETYEPSQWLAIQNCVSNSSGIAQTVEQILNDFVTTPNIQNIVADQLANHCSVSNSISAIELQNAIASEIMAAYLDLPLFGVIAGEVIAEYKYLEYDWMQNNSGTPNFYQRAKLFAKAYWNVINEAAHVTLDVCGFIPAFGEPCDLINGIIYTIEGDYTSASFSYAAMIPFAGWASTGTKYVASAVKSTLTGRTLNLTVKLVGNTVEFGSRDQLRRVIGLAKGNPLEAHHIIPWSLANHPLVQDLARNATQIKDFFHMNHPKNGIAVAAGRQSGGHTLYNSKVLSILNGINGLNQTKAYKKQRLVALQDYLYSLINNNPNVHLDNLNITFNP
jgi:hypothetical protein